MVESSNGQGPDGAGSRPGLPRPGPATPGFTRVSPAQEGAQGGWRQSCRPGCGPSLRCATHRRRQCSHRPPARKRPRSSPCRRCWPGPGRYPDPGYAPAPAGKGRGGGLGSPGAAAQWPPGGGRQTRFGCGRGGCVVLVGCSFSGVGLPFQNHVSQIHRNTVLAASGRLSLHRAAGLRWIRV